MLYFIGWDMMLFFLVRLDIEYCWVGGTLMLCLVRLDISACLARCDIGAPVYFQGQRVTGAMADCQNQQPMMQVTPLSHGAHSHRYLLSLTLNVQVTRLLQRFCSVNFALQHLPPTRN